MIRPQKVKAGKLQLAGTGKQVINTSETVTHRFSCPCTKKFTFWRRVNYKILK